MRAVLMAGGAGTRLRPLTCDLPKPLMPVLNRPIAEHTLAWLRGHGLTELIMTLHYLPDAVQSYFQDGREFGVLDVPKKERKSWVVWEEGKAPDIVIELLSESTINLDKGIKKQIYQNQMRVSEYYWYDPFNPADWAGFPLIHGVYQPMTVNAQGYLESPCTGLVFGQWLGDYRGVHTTWLRWANPDGHVLPTAQELAQQAQPEAYRAQQQADLAEQEARIAQQRAESAEQRANLAEQGAARLAQKLQELGIDLDQFQ